MQLPDGACLWQATGGAKAWSDEIRAGVILEHRLAILAWMKTENGSKGKNAPEPLPTPVFFTDADTKRQTALSKAKRFQELERAIKDRKLNSEE